MKLGMDSVTSSYFALFEVINHTFGLHHSFVFSVCSCDSPATNISHEMWASHFVANQTQCLLSDLFLFHSSRSA